MLNVHDNQLQEETIDIVCIVGACVRYVWYCGTLLVLL